MVAFMPATDIIKQILIVDRDVAAIEALCHKLNEVGYSARAIPDGAAAMAAVRARAPHLVIIDWNTQGLTALELIQGIRRTPMPQAVRLIILSALSAEDDIVTGLNLGADDYIAKPFSVREVIARVSALLRSRSYESNRRALDCDDLVIDPVANRVTARGRLINLRGVEYRLLEFLMQHRGRTIKRSQLLAQVWGDDSEVDERTVDVNVQRLRKILTEPGYQAYIQTVRGFGYRFAAPTAGEKT